MKTFNNAIFNRSRNRCLPTTAFLHRENIRPKKVRPMPVFTSHVKNQLTFVFYKYDFRQKRNRLSCPFVALLIRYLFSKQDVRGELLNNSPKHRL